MDFSVTQRGDTVALELVFSRLSLPPAPGVDATQRRAKFPLPMNRIEWVVCGRYRVALPYVHPELGVLSSFSGHSA